VNINSEYYKSRVELFKTCYGKSPYILGWYSISLDDAVDWTSANFQTTTSFIHDVFCKEVAKSSPFSEPNSALHLNIRIGEAGVTYQVLIGPSRETAPVADCNIDFNRGDALAANFVLQGMQSSSASLEADARVVQMPSALEYTKAFKNDFNQLLHAVKALAPTNPEAAELLKHLPDEQPTPIQVHTFSAELEFLHNLIKTCARELDTSRKIFTTGSSN